MILLISSKYDITSHYVCRWLKKYKKNYHLLISEDFNILNSFSISDTSTHIKINGIDLSMFNVIWHRRGRFRHIPKQLTKLPNYYEYLKKEEDALVKSIELYLKKKSNYIGSYLKETENYKLHNLIIAKRVGLKVPKTLVTTNKTELTEFIDKNLTITKDIRYPVDIRNKNQTVTSSGTLQLNKFDLELLDENFAPILVQEQIDKEIEIRVFFFDKYFYAMAIFSQNDEKTMLDYRNYNRGKPNRCVPFNLPKEIIDKLNRFSRLINIKTGSIDIILSKDGEFVFLEINPMGQLDWVSKNCNYYIEKDIANYLN